jgi:hypothetical protein
LIPRGVLLALVVTALLLPTAALVLFAAARLLSAMDDVAGATALERIVLAIALVWSIDLAALVCSLGVNSISGPPPPRDE